MTTFIFENNVSTTLASAVASTATTITLASSVNLPASIPTGTYFPITLNDAATRTVYEVCYATAVSGATLTVLRGQEGTIAQSWLTGDYAFSTVTAGQMQALESAFMANPMTNVGDIIVGTTGGAPSRLAAGPVGYIFTSTGPNSTPEWASGVTSSVTSFNSRTGAVALESADVTNALGYTPYSTAGGTISGNVIVNGTINASQGITGSALTSTGDVSIGNGAWLLSNSTGTLEVASANGVVATLSATGSLVAAGTIQAGSDPRVKSNIRVITDALEIVRGSFTGCTYRRTDQNGKYESGFLADDVQLTLPHLVSEHAMNGFDDFKTLDYIHIIPYLANAITELHDQVKALQREISQSRTP